MRNCMHVGPAAGSGAHRLGGPWCCWCGSAAAAVACRRMHLGSARTSALSCIPPPPPHIHTHVHVHPPPAGSRAAPSNAAARKGAAAPLPPFITLTNKAGMSVTLTAVGASIQALRVPARDGKGPATDVILGYKTAEAYRTPPLPSFGATVGRVANRISNASYTLDGRTVQLESNDGSNFIHGGAFRYSQQVWAAQRQDSAAGQAVTFRLTDRENIPNG